MAENDDFRQTKTIGEKNSKTKDQYVNEWSRY